MASPARRPTCRQVEALAYAFSLLGEDVLASLDQDELVRLVLLSSTFAARLAAALTSMHIENTRAALQESQTRIEKAIRWLTPRMAAARMSISPQTLYRYQRQGVLPFCHSMPSGKGFRVSEDELDDYLTKRK